MWAYCLYICCILSRGVALQVDCPPEWTPCPQSGTCIQVSLDEKSWDEARQDCRRRGSDLVKILDSQMNDWILKHFRANINQEAKGRYFYIGLLRPADKISFSWLNETSEANYMRNAYRKLLSPYKLCTMTYFDPTNQASWIGALCTKRYSYICEKIPVKLCPGDFYPNSNAGTCIKVVRQTMSWHKARAHCQTLGGDLAVILNDKVDQFLSDQTVTIGLRFMYSLWIGLNDIGSRSNFKWLDSFVDGVNYTNWKGNQPDSHSESNCVTLTQSIGSNLGSPIWDNTDCNEELPFICERFAGCEYEQYGMFCPKSCTSVLCADNRDACNRRNGICQNACSKGTYAEKCLKTCSPHCGGPEKACHFRDGSCLSGCEDGYKDVRCETACSNYTYGPNCSKVCSPYCGGQNKTCDHRDGSCLSGCKDGYTGFRCETEDVKSTRIPIPKYTTIAIVSAATFVCVVFLTCLLLQILIKNAENELQEMPTIAEEQHRSLDEYMAEEEYMTPEENMTPKEYMSEEEYRREDENMPKDENMAEDDNLAEE